MSSHLRGPEAVRGKGIRTADQETGDGKRRGSESEGITTWKAGPFVRMNPTLSLEVLSLSLSKRLERVKGIEPRIQLGRRERKEPKQKRAEETNLSAGQRTKQCGSCWG